MRRSVAPALALLAVASTLLLATGHVSSAPQAVSDSKALRGISRPRREVTLSFTRPGLVVELAVKRNDPIKAGALVARQDDTVEQAELLIDKADAADRTEIDAENTVLRADQVTLEKMQTAGTDFEKREAATKVEIDKARVIIAETKYKKAQIKVGATEAAIKRLSLYHSPEFDGVVAEVFLKQSETADGQNMKVVKIIQLDPLWVEVNVPTLQARTLKKGDSAMVAFPDGKDRPGKVDEIAVLADPATDKIMVRLEVNNPEKLQPGENVMVRLGAAATAVATPNK